MGEAGGGGGIGGGGGMGGGSLGCDPCPVGTKLVEADLTCHDERDPRHSCAEPSSDPCPSWPQAACQGGACVADCAPGFEDCGNGICETTDQFLRCGDCNTQCTTGEKCSPTSGCVQACPPGEIDCGLTCANLGTSNLHCGGCNFLASRSVLTKRRHAPRVVPAPM
ncbi:MAG: hypothetical protein R3B72_18300 [Polyangiaceae bacterium]